MNEKKKKDSINSYLEKKFNELSPEAKEKVEDYTYAYGLGVEGVEDYLHLKFKDGILNNFYGEPYSEIGFRFDELEKGLHVKATQAKYFVRDHRSIEPTLDPCITEKYHSMSKKDKIKLFTSNHKLYEIGYLLDLVDKAHDSCAVILEEYPIYTVGDALLSIAAYLGVKVDKVDVENIVNNSFIVGDETYNDLLKKIEEKLEMEENETRN